MILHSVATTVALTTVVENLLSFPTRSSATGVWNAFNVWKPHSSHDFTPLREIFVFVVVRHKRWHLHSRFQRSVRKVQRHHIGGTATEESLRVCDYTTVVGHCPLLFLETFGFLKNFLDSGVWRCMLPSSHYCRETFLVSNICRGANQNVSHVSSEECDTAADVARERELVAR
jgi:hypothetical protein